MASLTDRPALLLAIILVSTTLLVGQYSVKVGAELEAKDAWQTTCPFSGSRFRHVELLVRGRVSNVGKSKELDRPPDAQYIQEQVALAQYCVECSEGRCIVPIIEAQQSGTLRGVPVEVTTQVYVQARNNIADEEHGKASYSAALVCSRVLGKGQEGAIMCGYRSTEQTYSKMTCADLSTVSMSDAWKTSRDCSIRGGNGVQESACVSGTKGGYYVVGVQDLRESNTLGFPAQSIVNYSDVGVLRTYRSGLSLRASSVVVNVGTARLDPNTFNANRDQAIANNAIFQGPDSVETGGPVWFCAGKLNGVTVLVADVELLGSFPWLPEECGAFDPINEGERLYLGFLGYFGFTSGLKDVVGVFVGGSRAGLSCTLTGGRSYFDQMMGLLGSQDKRNGPIPGMLALSIGDEVALARLDSDDLIQRVGDQLRYNGFNISCGKSRFGGSLYAGLSMWKKRYLTSAPIYDRNHNNYGEQYNAAAYQTNYNRRRLCICQEGPLLDLETDNATYFASLSGMDSSNTSQAKQMLGVAVAGAYSGIAVSQSQTAVSDLNVLVSGAQANSNWTLVMIAAATTLSGIFTYREETLHIASRYIGQWGKKRRYSRGRRWLIVLASATYAAVLVGLYSSPGLVVLFQIAQQPRGVEAGTYIYNDAAATPLAEHVLEATVIIKCSDPVKDRSLKYAVSGISMVLTTVATLWMVGHSARKLLQVLDAELKQEGLARQEGDGVAL